ncbi:MAG: hypothetical protein MZU91_04630 [Desulfosudis oleivorans]|nr:hypothetical protein [Desulfosudis oleivorans]
MADKILERLPITILLNVLSMLLILVDGHPHRGALRRPPGFPLRPGRGRLRLHRFRRADLLAGPAAHDPLRRPSGLASHLRDPLPELRVSAAGRWPSGI